MLIDIKYRYQRITCITESRVSNTFGIEGKVVTVLAWTQHIKCRGLSEQPNDIRVAIKSYNKNSLLE